MSEPQKPATAAPEKVDETYTESKAKFEGKAKSEYFDPCQELAQKSIKCLHRNGGDRAMCGDYFQYAGVSSFSSAIRGSWAPAELHENPELT
ncbi:hypothetical protein COL5a_011529 [Colletotrichum fioriniae]|nr:uncharacterized protein COL516b_011988 [Colletotrichum fioriniae]KAJ0296028.1 hypothetical protein COL516b_011988 [Colletotrichum fioriniae]KAJ0316490.1 hypothetical protein COL5a_011529 [Colletotrichum fioriniae]